MSNEYNSVSKMLDALAPGDPLVNSIKHRIRERKIVKALQAMRLAKEVSQSRIAEELKCGQARISKIENGEDCDLSISEVEAYARALNCDVNIVFTRREETAVDRVKRHATCIRRELSKLAEFAHGDESIARAVASFMGEALFNLVKIVEDSIKQMPCADNGEPYIRITSVSESDCDVIEKTSDASYSESHADAPA